MLESASLARLSAYKLTKGLAKALRVGATVEPQMWRSFASMIFYALSIYSPLRAIWLDKRALARLERRGREEILFFLGIVLREAIENAVFFIQIRRFSFFEALFFRRC